MDKKKEFEKIMNEATKLALASSVDNVPNVRILNFVYSENENVLYFQSRKGDQRKKNLKKMKMWHLPLFRIKVYLMLGQIILPSKKVKKQFLRYRICL